MKQTYETDHPTITEITIGDKFVLNNGNIVTFVKYDKNYAEYPFIMIDMFSIKYTYTKYLTFLIHQPFDIRYRYIPLKDKLDLL